MNKLIKVGLINFIVLMLSYSAFGIKCFTCNSKEDSRCWDPLNETNGLPMLNCTNTEQIRKQIREAIEGVRELMTNLGEPLSTGLSTKKGIQPWDDENLPMNCQKLEISINGDLIVGRGCSSPRLENYDPCNAVKLLETTENVEIKFCSLCDTDGCNKGIRQYSASFIGIIAVLLTAHLIT